MHTFEINSTLTSKEFLLYFKNNWKNDKKWIGTNVTLENDPFKICVMQNFLKENKLIWKLVDEMCEVEWSRKQMDLYEFFQTPDLSSTEMPYLSQFYNYLKTNVMPWMADLSKIDLTHVSASCSMYNNGDHLLVHDDLLADRQIAFVFYLSPWSRAKEWTADMGGALELFSSDKLGLPKFPIEKALPPKNNQFIFFKVCNTSFHQVGEVTNFDYPRLTINGWFHGPKSCENSAARPIQSNLVAKYSNDVTINLDEWIEENYLKVNIIKSIQRHIELNSEASLESFLIGDFFNVVKKQLHSNDTSIKWILQGPAHQKKFDSLCLDTVKGPLKDLITLFSSPAFFNLLHEYTELDLAGPNAKKPLCTIEICRITQGCYSLLGDSSIYSDSSLDVIIFLNAATDNIGVITYLNPEEDAHDENEGVDDEEDEEKDPVLLSIIPKDNALNVVYRSEGTAKFLKYIPKNCISDKEYVYILTATYKE